MTTFISVCLYVFAGCAALEILPVAALAARAREPVMVVTALLLAAFVISVLIAAGRELAGR